MLPLSSKFIALLALIFLLILGGCTSTNTNEFTGKTSVRVELSPTLDYLSPAIQACALQSGRLNILLEEKPASEMGKTNADVSLLWGDRKIPEGNRTFRLGFDRLVFAAHTDNPIGRLPVGQAFLLYRGGFETWDEAIDQLCPDCETGETISGRFVEAWHYTPGTDIHAEIARLSVAYPASNIHRTFIAPAPANLAEALSNNPAAIGWLPARWLNDKMKEITIDGLDPYAQIIPVVAAVPDQPDDLLVEWLHCLQSSYGN